MAKLCRNVCSVAGLEMPAICFADVNARFSWRDEIGLILGLPRVSDILCMSNLVHASKLKEHEDNDDYQ